MILMMKSVSYIINASGLTESSFFKIQELLTSLKQDQLAEVLFYDVADQEAYQPSTRLMQIVMSSQTGVSSLQKAVASASGDNLVFTTVSNVIAGFEDILKSAQQIGNYQVGLPLSLSGVENRLGIYRINKCPFVVASKSFALSHTGANLNLEGIVQTANNQLELGPIDPVPTTKPPEFVIKKLTVYRPLLKLIKRKVRHVQKLRADRQEEARVLRLRNNVLDVPFSRDMPVFIICRDRVEPLKKLVDWLEKEEMNNIIFIDNASTYPPLLGYLEETTYEVVRLSENAGHTSPWSKGIVQTYAKNVPFIVTDPDVIPDKGAHGAVERFCELLTKYPERTKAGFGLKIDDLPDHYSLKDHVISWEAQFWESTVEPDVYDAEIDTTFAVYRQNTPYTLGPGLRMGGEYIARHEPWYIDSKNPDEELMYYRKHADKVIGSWGIDALDVTRTYEARHRDKNTSSL